MARSSVRSGLVVAAATLFASGCYIHTYVKDNANLKRSPTCPEAVALYTSPSEVARTYVALARISIWFPADMAAKPEDEQWAQRKKAAELGSNGLILTHPLDRHQTWEESSLAIFVPEDSAHAASVCHGHVQVG